MTSGDGVLFGIRAFGLAVLCLLSGWTVVRNGVPVRARETAPELIPDAACASCHREIYERYRKTPMANASGPASEGILPADFRHGASGVHYQIYEQGSQVWLNYERDDPSRELKGRLELKYFLGSGKRGRTYLFERQGYWFESPINWYAKKKIWDMAPNYLEAGEAPLALPVDPGCLHCHASGVAAAEPDARNHYAGPPIADGGIRCVACHGNASAHIASAGKVHLMDIDHIEPARRDSVCLNCHLEGQVAVVRMGKELGNFKPGDNLSDFALFFNYRGERGSGGRATSQWEALLRSECKQKSGDRLTCTTCHDPHGSPAPAERVAYFRQRCLQCHAALEANHHRENPDCTSCHMARPPSNDIAHEQVTDHWIQRRVTQVKLPLVSTGVLEVVGGASVGDRDLGVAYAQMAARGDHAAANRAEELLLQAEKESDGAQHDHELHSQLGFLDQMNGRVDDATVEYRRALEADPFSALAGGNLALIEAQRHRYNEAEKLWTSVFEHDPVELGAGMNLAVVECGVGEREAALRTLNRLLEFAPDDDRARAMEAAIRGDVQKCIRR
jgi:predicted CXXCH cytochrome family protein